MVFCVSVAQYECYFTSTVDLSVPGKVDEKATQLHAIASLKVLLDATKPQNGSVTTNHVVGSEGSQETELAASLTEQPNGVAGALEEGIASDVSTHCSSFILLIINQFQEIGIKFNYTEKKVF